MRFEIKHRWSAEVIFTAEIDADENTPLSIRLGLAVRKAVEAKADLRYADLSSANLRSANLSSANLIYADLSYADLRQFKADFWMILTQACNEVPGLISALRDGRVDGSTYHGECACLVGTIANVRGVDVDDLETGTDSSRPAEQWFLMIRKGDKPGDDTGGGFASQQALDWALEFCALNGIDPEPKAEIAA